MIKLGLRRGPGIVLRACSNGHFRMAISGDVILEWPFVGTSFLDWPFRERRLRDVFQNGHFRGRHFRMAIFGTSFLE